MFDRESPEGSTRKKRGNPQNLVAPWKPGQSGNPKCRKLGSRDRKTVILEALRRIAEAGDMAAEDLEKRLQASGIQHALKGQPQPPPVRL